MAAVLLFCAALAGPPAFAQTAGPQAAEQAPQRRQDWLVPSSVPGLMMHSQVFRPPGPGPFPLAVISHGSTQSPLQRQRLPPPRFADLTAFLVARGYAVIVPERPGHGATGGPYLEDQNGCDDADYVSSGLRTADSIQAAIDYMTKQKFVRRDGILVIGQSAGGWGALALASRNPRGVAAVINFAGGRGGRVNNRAGVNCAPDRLVEAADLYGRSARVPTLWIYAANDSYFAPPLAARMAEAFRRAGGKVRLHAVAAFGRDGHDLVREPEGRATWEPILARFLAGLR